MIESCLRFGCMFCCSMLETNASISFCFVLRHRAKVFGIWHFAPIPFKIESNSPQSTSEVRLLLKLSKNIIFMVFQSIFLISQRNMEMRLAFSKKNFQIFRQYWLEFKQTPRLCYCQKCIDHAQRPWSP